MRTHEYLSYAWGITDFLDCANSSGLIQAPSYQLNSYNDIPQNCSHRDPCVYSHLSPLTHLLPPLKVLVHMS